MNRRIQLHWLCWLVAGLGACRPADKSQPAAAGLADTAALAGQVDSSHQIKQDGLAYLPLNTGTYRQLPPELTEILNQQYPGWVLPELSAEAVKQVKRDAQGPYFVGADFDRNGLRDFAVQFQFRDSTLVAAFLQQRRQPPVKYILARQPLARIKGEQQSRLVVSQDSPRTVGAPEPAAPGRRLSQAGIAIGSPGNRRVFVFKGGRFSLLAGQQVQGR